MYPDMNMPHTILCEIDRVLQANRRKCIQVYEEAEKVRQKWAAENVALEDIVMAFADRCGFYDVAMSFDPRGAIDALMGRRSLRD